MMAEEVLDFSASGLIPFCSKLELFVCCELLESLPISNRRVQQKRETRVGIVSGISV